MHPRNPAANAPRAPETLHYPSRRAHGRYEVTTPDGAVAARVRVSRTPRRPFEVSGPDGAVVCRVRRVGMLSGRWKARDVEGNDILTVRRREVYTADGFPHRLDVSALTANWRLLDRDGAVVLHATAPRGVVLRRPEYVVHCLRPSLSLAEAVAVIEISWQSVTIARADWLPS